MKPFIVSMGIIIIGVFALAFRTDIDRYTKIEENLQNLTEECACYGAWALEPTDDGIRINERMARNNVSTLINYAKQNMLCFADGDILVDDIVVDDYTKRTIFVKLSFISNKSFFREAFTPKINTVSWESFYEWK